MNNVALGTAFGAGVVAVTGIAVGNELLNVQKQTTPQGTKKAIAQGFVASTVPPTLAAGGAAIALLSGHKSTAYGLGAAALGGAIGQFTGGVASIFIAES
jgi:hypothetical protein